MVWLDAEMTGLYPGVDALVEVAIIITDADLNVLDDGIDIIIKPPAAAVEQMDPVVVEMHRNNGLAEQWQHGVNAAEAEQRLLDRSEEHTSELQSRGHLVCRLLLEKKKDSTTIKSRGDR